MKAKGRPSYYKERTVNDYTKIIGEVKKARYEALEAVNTPGSINLTIRQEKEAEPMKVTSFRDITNAPSGTVITINTYSYMKTHRGMWVYHNGDFMSEFDFFISLLRAADSHMEIRLAYYPGRH